MPNTTPSRSESLDVGHHHEHKFVGQTTHLLSPEQRPAGFRHLVSPLQVDGDDEVPFLVVHVLDRLVAYYTPPSIQPRPRSFLVSTGIVTQRSERGDNVVWVEDGEFEELTEDPSIVDEDVYGTERLDGLFHDGFTFGHAPRCGDRLTSGCKEGRRA
jgi:hypothetical protein